MADIETQSEGSPRRAESNRASSAESPSRAAGKSPIDPEPRSFAAASGAAERAADLAKQAAETGMKSGQDTLKAGREAAQRATGQAVDFWRASLDPITHLQTEMSRWFEQTWAPGANGRRTASALLSDWMWTPLNQPITDLRDTGDTIELDVELPGMKAGDIDLSLEGDVLHLSAKKAAHADQSDGEFRVRERRFGHFERTFVLASGLDRNRITATFHDGVLRVVLARKAREAVESHRIPVKG